MPPTDVVIAENIGEISALRQWQGITAADFTETFYGKVLRCGNVYPESQLKGIFVEGLLESVLDNMRKYWGLNRQVALCQLAQCANRNCKLKITQASLSTAPRGERPRIERNGNCNGPFISVTTASETEEESRDGTASNSSRTFGSLGTMPGIAEYACKVKI